MNPNFALNKIGYEVILIRELSFSSARFCIPSVSNNMNIFLLALVLLTAPTIAPNSDNRFFVPSQSLEEWFCIFSCLYL
jgi:hypothetical protein